MMPISATRRTKRDQSVGVCGTHLAAALVLISLAMDGVAAGSLTSLQTKHFRSGGERTERVTSDSQSDAKPASGSHSTKLDRAVVISPSNAENALRLALTGVNMGTREIVVRATDWDVGADKGQGTANAAKRKSVGRKGGKCEGAC